MLPYFNPKNNLYLVQLNRLKDHIVYDLTYKFQTAQLIHAGPKENHPRELNQQNRTHLIIPSSSVSETFLNRLSIISTLGD